MAGIGLAKRRVGAITLQRRIHLPNPEALSAQIQTAVLSAGIRMQALGRRQVAKAAFVAEQSMKEFFKIIPTAALGLRRRA
jgi:hypothetical protein